MSKEPTLIEPTGAELTEVIDNLQEAELRRLIELAQRRLRSRAAAEPAGLVLTNTAETPLKISVFGAETALLEPEESRTLVPAAFDAKCGRRGAAATHFLWSILRTSLLVKIENDAKTAGSVKISVNSWRQESPRLGAPEVMIFATQEGKTFSQLCYQNIYEFDVPSGEGVTLVAVGRGPEEDAGRIIRRFFEPPPQVAAEKSERGSSDAPESAEIEEESP